MTENNIFENLNPPQLEAVTAEEHNLLILAGAGSGKTRVLVHRIAWLLREKQVSPFAILAVTFTNKAAHEMRERTARLVNCSVRSLWIGTFHGLAHRLLRRHWQMANLPENFQVLDAEDQRRVIRRVMRDASISEDDLPPKQALWFINKQKNKGLRPQNIDDQGDYTHRLMLHVYQLYDDVCRNSGLVDFAELLLRSHELWLNNDELLTHYQNRFQHILVDEFQDTNTIQYAWLRMLAGGADSNIMAVGDDDQSIYGWRGAEVANIYRFKQDFPAVKTIKLEQNYRSSATILNAANALIAHNDDRIGKKLWTAENGGELIALHGARNEHDEARFIADEIMSLNRQDGYAYKDCGVFYRSNAQSRILEEALLHMSIPYRIYGGLRFFERAEIKDVLAYLRLLIDRDSDAAFERIVNYPTRGIGSKTIDKIRAAAAEENTSLWQAGKNLLTNNPDNELTARAASALQRFINLIEEMDANTADTMLEDQVAHVITSSGLIEQYKKDKSEKGRARVENLEELINAAKQFSNFDNFTIDDEEEENLSPLQQFLAHAALEAGEAQSSDANNDCVQLMTLHSAKGLEFPIVFLAGMEAGLFPHQMSMAEPKKLQEERRLCYVGITRAMHKLYLTYTQLRTMYGEQSYRRSSQFIHEIPKKYLKRVGGTTTKVSQPLNVYFTDNSSRQQKKNYSHKSTPQKSTLKKGQQAGKTGFTLGQLVKHNTFGEGVILNFDGDQTTGQVQVQFKKAGTKWLSLKFAKLTAVGIDPIKIAT